MNGYMMPAEWELHEATWISWPKNTETFPKAILPQVEGIYIQMIAALCNGEKVNLLVDDEKTEQKVRKMLDNGNWNRNVGFYRIKTADVWIRDYGPIFVKDENGGIHATKWGYNAYGNKYDDLKEDDEVAEKITGFTKHNLLKPGIMLEGGSIEVNGNGTLITTEQCLLNENRNSRLNKKQIETYLKDYFGVSNIIWLKNGIKGDDTDGHIDDMVRFANKTTVLCALERDKTDENYSELKKNFEILQKAKDQNGEKLEVTALPMPNKVESEYGRLPASYANFYIGNEVVLLPVFNQKTDEMAIDLLEECFPKRKIVPIECTALVHGLGGIHCVTQQQPK